MSDSTSYYDLIGGDAGVRALAERFYRQMDEDPSCARIRHLHPADLNHSRDKLYLFLSGWLGGPPLYVEQYGHPMLRRRHLPFPIGGDERDQWMRCMVAALADSGLDEAARQHLVGSFFNTADFMRNREDPR
ncbi:MAG: hemoglobin-like protein [Betaproteobacteria bacterium]|jgi:hemoglobin|nr:hemoglobin-like protein [Betaproteobacteria bacterium]NCU85456.1 hemoglobin-like protein [Betaproteobacteria bacterium]